MNRKHEYNVGDVYGLKSITRIWRNKDDNCLWIDTVCTHCGKTLQMRARMIFDQRNQSCSCTQRKYRDGNEIYSRLYAIWANMKYRCNTRSCPAYFRYGGTGIKVCSEWNDFEQFKEWAIVNGYSDNLTIDRIDTHGDYCPENCQWITKSDNTAKANKVSQHRKSDRGEYYAISPAGTFLKFDNAEKFGRDNNLCGAQIRRCSRSGNTYNGWKFGYTSQLVSEAVSTIESITGNCEEASRVHDEWKRMAPTIGEDIVSTNGNIGANEICI